MRREHPEVRWRAADAAVGRRADRAASTTATSTTRSSRRSTRRSRATSTSISTSRSRRAASASSPGPSTPRRPRCAHELDAFFAEARRDGTLARLAERYFAPRGEVERIDAGVFQDRIRTVLPRYRRMFDDAQEATGIEWRLLAAVAYQESQWDPLATSETGVRGFMQLTEDTARHLGVADRLDPRAERARRRRATSRDLKARLPARIDEPDRTWLALAAFNIGLGHLEDARVLAQRQKLDPDPWQRREAGAAAARAARVLREGASSATRAAACRSRSSTACARYYDILLRTRAPHRRGCASDGRRSPDALACVAHVASHAWRFAAARPRVLALLAAPHGARPHRSCPSRRADLDRAARRDRAPARRRSSCPIGGTEQNGPHMALGKHNVRAQRARRADRARARQRAGRAGDRLRARRRHRPADRRTCASPARSPCPCRRSSATLESAARSFRLHGFRDIVFLGDHGGYQSEHRGGRAQRLNRDWAATPARAHARRRVLPGRRDRLRAALRARGFRDAEIGTHAGLADTSLTLALDPALVRSDRLAAPLGAGGVDGDPRRASAGARRSSASTPSSRAPSRRSAQATAPPLIRYRLPSQDAP